MRRRFPLVALCLAGTSTLIWARAGVSQERAPQVPAAPQAAAPAAQPTGAKVWIGRYAEYEEFLKTAAIVKITEVPIGVTRPKKALFAEGELAAGAALKHLPPGRRSGFWESYKSEIAAYRLDRMLGLDMVPPTVERRAAGEFGSLQLWVESTRWVKDADQSKVSSSPPWMKQVCRQRTFDNLIANVDRNEGNLLVDDEWNLILIDHSRAFASNKMPFMKEMQRIDREFYDKLKALDEPTLMRELKPWVLGSGEVRDVLKRRDKIIEQFDSLVKEKGEAAVFPF